MQVEQGEALDPDVIRAVFHKQLNSPLVIQGHLRFFRILAFRFLAILFYLARYLSTICFLYIFI